MKNAISLIKIAVLCMFFINKSHSEISANVDIKKIEKYQKWKEAVNNPENYVKTFAFFYNNPHWPLFEKCVLKAEENIDTKSPDSIIIKWFKRYGPKTSFGITAYITSLLKFDKVLAKKFIRQTWIFQNLSPKFTKEFREKYGKYISSEDDAKKAKRLIDQKQYQQLTALEEITTKKISLYIQSYLKKKLKIEQEAYSLEDLDNIELKYDIIQMLINKKKEHKAAKILAMNNDNEEKYADKFFKQRRHIACYILKSGNPILAYKIIKLCKLNTMKKDEINLYVKSEWLQGFIAFRFLKKLDIASKHFENAYRYSKNFKTLSKNAYWLGELYREKKDVLLALEWYKKACQYFNSFYGYLAYDKVQDISNNDLSIIGEFYSGAAAKIPLDKEIIFKNRELVQVLCAIYKSGRKEDTKLIAAFYDQLIDEIEDPMEELLLMEMAASNEEIKYLISTGSSHQKYFNNKKIYKFLDPEDLNHVKKINSDPCFISLVHSIIHRESNFDQSAKSPVGAIGLMQVMPSTAIYEAKKINFYIGEKVSLFNKQKNITIGSFILNRLLKKYKNNLIYVIAAYNCGEGNVSKFQKSIKNLKNLDFLSTIELIPYKETRIYVKHVIRSMFTYQKMLNAGECYNCGEFLKE